MKKLLGIVFMGLLLSGSAYADHSLSLESVLPNPKCDGLELRLWHDAGGKYIIYVKNPTKVSVKIHSIKFLISLGVMVRLLLVLAPAVSILGGIGVSNMIRLFT